MASFKILPILEKQKALFERASSPKELSAWGDFYREQGRVYDAIDFYEKASARERVEEIRKEAVASGNLFLFRRTLQVLREEPLPAELQEIATRAEGIGKVAYARMARGEPLTPPKEEPRPATDPTRA